MPVKVGETLVISLRLAIVRGCHVYIESGAIRNATLPSLPKNQTLGALPESKVIIKTL